MDTSTQVQPKRRYRSLEEKRRIVAEASEPGASVAAVARKHGVNANLVFGWLRLTKSGALSKDPVPPPLLPVKVISPTLTPTQRGVTRSTRSNAEIPASEAVEIVIGEALRIRLQGAAAKELVREILKRIALS